jgi:hypothetical protein
MRNGRRPTQSRRTTTGVRRQQANTSGSRAKQVRDVTTSRSLKPWVDRLLWGRSAGRCEFAGCNRPLWKSEVTQEQVNTAQKAHIYAFSSGGPRHNAKISGINDLSNLILVCHGCHRKIDKEKDGGRYTATLLKQWKRAHEQRVELVTGIKPQKKSWIVLYGANIGEHSSPLNYADAATALFPERYPASDTPIELSTVDSSVKDRDAEFWARERTDLVTKFERRIRERITGGEISHLSIFGLAPQPLLILFGTLLGDIVPMDVYQRHREPKATWNWPRPQSSPRFEVKRPTNVTGNPALVVAFSGTITPDRVRAVLGDEASIWTVTVPKPHNDIVKSRQQLSEFRTLLRLLLDEIKTIHGQSTALHVFPAAPVATNIELGRVRMPKADMSWRVYDQNNERGGFVPALTIP